MRLFFFISLIFLVSACSVHRLARKGVYREIDASEFLNYVVDSNVNIIDVRTAKEYDKSHITLSVNASYFGGKFSDLIDSLKLDPTKTTLIYCETQHRSLFAAKILYKKGFNKIIDLNKGMSYWRKAGYPFETQ